jgi:hypothetical protein
MMAAFIGFAGGVVAGAAAIYAAVLAVDRAFARLENTEIRRMKVACVVNLTGARFVLDKKAPHPEDQARFNFELNKIPVLFADDEAVMSAYRLFAADPQTIEKIHPLIEALVRSVKITRRVERQEFERVLRAG